MLVAVWFRMQQSTAVRRTAVSIWLVAGLDMSKGQSSCDRSWWLPVIRAVGFWRASARDARTDAGYGHSTTLITPTITAGGQWLSSVGSIDGRTVVWRTKWPSDNYHRHSIVWRVHGGLMTRTSCRLVIKWWQVQHPRPFHFHVTTLGMLHVLVLLVYRHHKAVSLLESTISRKLSFFGHTARKSRDCLEKEIVWIVHIYRRVCP